MLIHGTQAPFFVGKMLRDPCGPWSSCYWQTLGELIPLGLPVPVSQSKYTRFTLLGTSLQGPGAGSAAGFKQRGVSPPCMGWTRLSLCEPASRASIFNPPDHWLPGSGQVAPYTGSDCTLSRVETSPYSTDR